MSTTPSVPDRDAAVGEIRFTVMPLAQAVQWVVDASTAVADGTLGHPGLAVHFCNAYNVALARDDVDYAGLIDSADVVFSDGVPITWIGKRAYPTKAHRWERVYGPDVMRGVLDARAEAGVTDPTPRHYLLGGSPDTLAALREGIASEHPEAQIVGAESPPFRSPSAAELQERDQRIVDSGATIVWVGLGTPKQDVEVARLARTIPVTAMAVGAAFDFLAGTKAQAPVWMQRSGLEWAFRLASEPGRLGRRYLWGNSLFAMEAARTMRAARRDR